jgi:predicted RNase H-like HicB family nuclease
MKTIHVIYHQEDEGWWAESPEVEGWSAAGASYEEVSQLVKEGIPFALGQDVALQHETPFGGGVAVANKSSIRRTRKTSRTAKANTRTVTPRGGGWTVDKPGASRASSRHDTQAEAIDAARGYLQKEGGGELKIKGTDGKIRAQDTVPNGNDPRRSRG